MASSSLTNIGPAIGIGAGVGLAASAGGSTMTICNGAHAASFYCRFTKFFNIFKMFIYIIAVCAIIVYLLYSFSMGHIGGKKGGRKKMIGGG